METERIKWIDLAKGIAIILVVAGHAIQKNSEIIMFIYVFHIPFFFVMAGYLLNIEKWACNFSEFKSKIQQRLLLPYFKANFLFLPLWFIFFRYFEIFSAYGWEKCEPSKVLLAIFIGNNETFDTKLLLYQLWFLPCLFFAELIFLKVQIFFGKNKFFLCSIIIALTASGYLIGNSLQLPLGLDTALFAQIFLFTGFLIKQNNLTHKINLPVCIILFLTVFFMPVLNSFTTMDKRIYGNPILFYVGGIAGTLFIMKIAMHLENFGNGVCNYIKYCGQKSMAILIFHVPIIAVVFNLAVAIEPELWSTEFELFITMCGVIFPVLIAKNFGDKPILKYFCT